MLRFEMIKYSEINSESWTWHWNWSSLTVTPPLETLTPRVLQPHVGNFSFRHTIERAATKWIRISLKCADRLFYSVIPAICRGFSVETFVFLFTREKAGWGLSDWSRGESGARIHDFVIVRVKERTQANG